MSIARHTTYNLIGSIVPLAVSLVTVPLYLKLIGLDVYGVLLLCWTLLGYMGFLNFGLGPSVTQRMAVLGKGQGEEQAGIFWTALWLSLALGIVAGLLVYGLADFYFTGLENPPAGLSGQIDRAKGWLAAIIPVMMLSSVLTGALQGHESFLSMNAITSVASILMSVAPLAVAFLLGTELWWLLAASLGARIASLLALFVACGRAIPGLGLQGIDRRLAGSVLAFGGWMTADGVLGSLLLTFDRFAIGTMLGPTAVSIYTVPQALVTNIHVIPTALGKVLFPRFAASAEPEQGDRLELKSIATLAAIMTPICVAMMAAAGPFLQLWIGRETGLQAAPVAYFIVAAMCLNSVAGVPFMRMLGAGRPDLIAKIHLVEVPPYLILLFVGLSWFGVVGAAAAWCARMVADAVIFLAFAGQRRQALAILIVPTLLIGAALAAALGLPMEAPLRWVILVAVAAAALVWSFRTLPGPVRELLLAQLRRLR